jgi:hypothetical protein
LIWPIDVAYLLRVTIVEKLCFWVWGRAKICRAAGSRIEKKFGAAEVDVEVAGDRRSQIAVALNTDFRSRCHLVEFLWHTVYPSIKLVESV